jgi:uncharacterized membrane protein
MPDTAPLAAKHPRSNLAGPYGHPFHPILVTVPIGAWTASLVFDVIAFLVEEPAPYVLGAQVLIAVGVVGALVAAVFGLLDLSVIPPGTRAKRTALTHMTLNLGVVVVFVVGFLVRVAAGHDAVPILGVVLTVLGMAVLGFSGYLGGELAYRYGVRVASEETQAEGFRRPGH